MTFKTKSTICRKMSRSESILARPRPSMRERDSEGDLVVIAWAIWEA